MNRLKKCILITVIAVILNVGGRYLAFSNGWPMYFNLCGTLLASYLAGPIVGAIAAALGCALCLTFSFGDLYYLIADLFVAVAAGLIAKKNRYFKKFSLIYSATAFFTIVKATVLLLINLSANSGKTGFYIVDAIFDYLDSLSAPAWLGYILASLALCFTDMLAAMLIVYFGMLIFRSVGRRSKAKDLKKELMKKVALGFAICVMLISASGNSLAFADNSISFIEKLYNSDNGLVGGCLNDFAMTMDGSMWIATYGGLFRFNGYKFVLIDNLDSVRSVQSLFVDEDDRLWVGTQDSGVTLMNIDMTWRTLDMSSGLPSNSVKCISRDSNGLYYFGTTGGIVTAEFDNGEVVIKKINTKAGNIRDFSPDENGHMIVMNNVGGVSCFENGECIAELDLGEFSAKGIKHNSAGNIYIGTNSEKILIARYDSKGFRLIGSIATEGMKTTRDFYFEENGIIYVAADNGIGYIDENGHSTMIESGTFNNSIDHILKDYQGNIWFTSSRCGLLCLGKSCFTDVFKLCNEKNTVCNAIKEWNGYLYVGSNDGLKILDVHNGESIGNEMTESFDGIRIRCLDISSDGNLLVATYDKGLIEVTPDGNYSNYVSPDDTDKMIRMVKSLSDGTIISSSDARVVFMKDHKVLRELVMGEDLAGGIVLNVLETDDHTLLCGTDGDGIALIKDGKLERYISRDEGLPSGVILRVARDAGSDGYFVMTGSGLCYMDKALNVREIRMPYYNNFDVAFNNEGEIFVLGGAGIYISDYDAMMKDGRMEKYTLLDSKAGLPGSITSNAWNYVTDDEHIYICGTSGIYMLDLNNYEMAVDDFKTKITAITRDGVYEDVTEVGTIFIPKDTGRIELSLEINNYTTADPFVSYYMSGVDSEKITVPASKLGGVTYYDIPYGNHDFVISVLNEKGMELSKQTYIFSKERELFETVGFTLYFYLVIFTFIVFVVISIVQGALWSQRKRETGRHELVVNQLEREKSEALERALRMEENANRSKSEFLANMAREIKTPINAIIGMDTMIIRESNEENIISYARDIDVAGRKLVSLINNVHEFSKSGKMEGRLEEGAEEVEKAEDRVGEQIADEVSARDFIPVKAKKCESAEDREIYHAPDAKILVVDDVEMNITVAKNLLKRIQVQVDTACNGEEAMNLCRDNQYDIILLDSTMPGMNGEDTMHNIRKQCPDNADTPMIVTTSNAVEGAREEYLNLGYTNYLSKPLDGKKLEAMIQSYLPDEKIVFIYEETEEKDTASETERKLAAISKIKGIDADKGVEIAGGEDAYVLLCRNFFETALDRIKQIKECLEDKDYAAFDDKVQDLRNAARLIGAFKLSKQAGDLSSASLEGDLKKLKSDTDKVLLEYGRLHDEFSGVF